LSINDFCKGHILFFIDKKGDGHNIQNGTKLKKLKKNSETKILLKPNRNIYDG